MTIFLLLVMDLLISLFIIFMDWLRSPKNALQCMLFVPLRGWEILHLVLSWRISKARPCFPQSLYKMTEVCWKADYDRLFVYLAKFYSKTSLFLALHSSHIWLFPTDYMGQPFLETSCPPVEISHLYQHLNFYHRIQKGHSIRHYSESDKFNPNSRALMFKGPS